MNHHDRDTFARIAKALKRDFQVLPLAAMDDVLKRPQRHGRTVFLMSDDGYANTLTHAADVLEELRLPWTLFVSTHHIDTGARNPAFLTRLFFEFAPEGRYSFAPLEPFDLTAATRQQMCKTVITQLRNTDAMLAEKTVAAMIGVFTPQERETLLNRFPSEVFLSWDQVRTLERRGVEIGAHAHWHWPMNEAQRPETLVEQARRPRLRVEAEVGRCRFFAYPFGRVGDITGVAWQAVRDAGYDYAFTTLAGTLDASPNPFLMPRYGIGPRDTQLASLIPLLSAGNRRLAHWQKSLDLPHRSEARHAAE